MAGKCRTGNEQAKGKLIPAKHEVVMNMKIMVDLSFFCFSVIHYLLFHC